jgi:phospholipid transport system substrate-binding protein
MKILRTMLLIAGVISSSTIIAQGSPVPMLEKTANGIIATLKENKANLKKNPSIIYSAVESHLLPIVDVAGMSGLKQLQPKKRSFLKRLLN